MTADLISDLGGIILQKELYDRDEIFEGYGRITEYYSIWRDLRLYIDEFEPSDLMWHASNLIDRYEISLHVILYGRTTFKGSTDVESKEYLEDTRQLIESRLMPVTKKVKIVEGEKITFIEQTDIMKLAMDLKSILASL